MKIDLRDLTGQESGILVYSNSDTIICNWAAVGAGLPRLFGDMFLLSLQEDNVEIIESGETDDLSTLHPEEWDVIYDVNNDAQSLTANASRWRWWRLEIADDAADQVLVIAPDTWA